MNSRAVNPTMPFVAMVNKYMLCGWLKFKTNFGTSLRPSHGVHSRHKIPGSDTDERVRL